MLFTQYVNSLRLVFLKFLSDRRGDEMAQKAVITIVLVIGVLGALGYLGARIVGLLNGAADGM